MDRVHQINSGLRTLVGIFGDSFLWAVTISAAVSTAVILSTMILTANFAP